MPVVNLPAALLAISVSFTTTYLATATEPIHGLKPTTALAGFFGAVVTILVQKPVGARETMAIAFCGTVCAIYGTPYVARWFGVETDREVFALILGVAGIYICRRLVDLVQNPQSTANAIREHRWLDLLTTDPRPLATIEVKTVVLDPKSPADAPTKG